MKEFLRVLATVIVDHSSSNVALYSINWLIFFLHWATLAFRYANASLFSQSGTPSDLREAFDYIHLSPFVLTQEPSVIVFVAISIAIVKVLLICWVVKARSHGFKGGIIEFGVVAYIRICAGALFIPLIGALSSSLVCFPGDNEFEYSLHWECGDGTHIGVAFVSILLAVFILFTSMFVTALPLSMGLNTSCPNGGLLSLLPGFAWPSARADPSTPAVDRSDIFTSQLKSLSLGPTRMDKESTVADPWMNPTNKPDSPTSNSFSISWASLLRPEPVIIRLLCSFILVFLLILDTGNHFGARPMFVNHIGVCIALGGLSLVDLYSTTVFLPFQSMAMNQLSAAATMVLLWTILCIGVSDISIGIAGTEYSGIYTRTTTAWAFTLLFAFLAGVELVSAQRRRYSKIGELIGKRRGTNGQFYRSSVMNFSFFSMRIDAIARATLATIPTSDAVKYAYTCYEKALFHRPGDAKLHISFSNFVYSCGNGLLEMAHLQLAEKCESLTLLQRLYIDVRRIQVRERAAIRSGKMDVGEVSSISTGHFGISHLSNDLGPLDTATLLTRRLAFEIERSRTLQHAKDALLQLARFWTLVEEYSPDCEDLEKLAYSAYSNLNGASSGFEKLLNLAPYSIVTMREYAHYLTCAGGDGRKAAALLESAEAAEEVASRRQHRGTNMPYYYLSREPYLDTSSDNIAIFVVDVMGTIREVNDAALVLYGYSRAQLVGRPFTALLPYGLSQLAAAQQALALSGDRTDRLADEVTLSVGMAATEGHPQRGSNGSNIPSSENGGSPIATLGVNKIGHMILTTSLVAALPTGTGILQLPRASTECHFAFIAPHHIGGVPADLCLAYALHMNNGSLLRTRFQRDGLGIPEGMASTISLGPMSVTNWKSKFGDANATSLSILPKKGWTIVAADAPTLSLLGASTDELVSRTLSVERIVPNIGERAATAAEVFHRRAMIARDIVASGGRAHTSVMISGNSKEKQEELIHSQSYRRKSIVSLVDGTDSRIQYARSRTGTVSTASADKQGALPPETEIILFRKVSRTVSPTGKAVVSFRLQYHSVPDAPSVPGIWFASWKIINNRAPRKTSSNVSVSDTYRHRAQSGTNLTSIPEVSLSTQSKPNTNKTSSISYNAAPLHSPSIKDPNQVLSRLNSKCSDTGNRDQIPLHPRIGVVADQRVPNGRTQANIIEVQSRLRNSDYQMPSTPTSTTVHTESDGALYSSQVPFDNVHPAAPSMDPSGAMVLGIHEQMEWPNSTPMSSLHRDSSDRENERLMSSILKEQASGQLSPSSQGFRAEDKANFTPFRSSSFTQDDFHGIEDDREDLFADARGKIIEEGTEAVSKWQPNGAQKGKSILRNQNPQSILANKFHHDSGSDDEEDMPIGKEPYWNSAVSHASSASAISATTNAADILHRYIEARKSDDLDPSLRSLRRKFLIIFMGLVVIQIATFVLTWTGVSRAETSIDRLQAAGLARASLLTLVASAQSVVMSLSGAGDHPMINTFSSHFAAAWKQASGPLFNVADDIDAGLTGKYVETEFIPKDDVFWSLASPYSAQISLNPHFVDEHGLPPQWDDLSDPLESNTAQSITAARAAVSKLLSDLHALELLTTALHLQQLDSASIGSNIALGNRNFRTIYAAPRIRVVGRPNAWSEIVRELTITQALAELSTATRLLASTANNYIESLSNCAVQGTCTELSLEPLTWSPALYIIRNAPTSIAEEMRIMCEEEALEAEESVASLEDSQIVVFLFTAVLGDAILVAFSVPLAQRLASQSRTVFSLFLLVPKARTSEAASRAMAGASRIQELLSSSDLDVQDIHDDVDEQDFNDDGDDDPKASGDNDLDEQGNIADESTSRLTKRRGRRHLKRSTRAYARYLFCFSGPKFLILFLFFANVLWLVAALTSGLNKAPALIQLAHDRIYQSRKYAFLARTAALYPIPIEESVRSMPVEPTSANFQNAGVNYYAALLSLLNVTKSAIEETEFRVEHAYNTIIHGSIDEELPPSQVFQPEEYYMFFRDGCSSPFGSMLDSFRALNDWESEVAQLVAHVPADADTPLISMSWPNISHPSKYFPHAGKLFKASLNADIFAQSGLATKAGPQSVGTRIFCDQYSSSLQKAGLQSSYNSFLQYGREIISSRLSRTPIIGGDDFDGTLDSIKTFISSIDPTAITVTEESCALPMNYMRALAAAIGGKVDELPTPLQPPAGASLNPNVLHPTLKSPNCSTTWKHLFTSPTDELGHPDTIPSSVQTGVTQHSALRKLITLDETLFTPALFSSPANYSKQAYDKLYFIRVVHACVFAALVVLLIILFLGVYNPLLRLVDTTLVRVRSLLLHIPQEALLESPKLYMGYSRIAMQLDSGSWLQVSRISDNLDNSAQAASMARHLMRKNNMLSASIANRTRNPVQSSKVLGESTSSALLSMASNKK